MHKNLHNRDKSVYLAFLFGETPWKILDETLRETVRKTIRGIPGGTSREISERFSRGISPEKL